MDSTIVLPHEMDKLKISTIVELIPSNRTKPIPFRTYFDTGSTDTVMSAHLFKALGFKEQNRLKVTITGINGKSEGFSTVINNFIIGGVDLDKTSRFYRTDIFSRNILASIAEHEE